MGGNPQRKATVTKIYSTNPKKPNSANRKVAKVKLNTGFFLISAIKGIKHNIKKFSKVWVQGVGFKDTPLVRSKLIIGKDSFLSLNPILKRRSIYGIKKQKRMLYFALKFLILFLFFFFYTDKTGYLFIFFFLVWNFKVLLFIFLKNARFKGYPFKTETYR